MSKSNSINHQIFYALKISESSNVPVLFMSAPGMGKSTSVKWYAEAEGYALETLRGNSTSEDEIMGYDVVDTTPGARSALHLIPDWFKRVLDNEKAGKKTLLFVDEITTCTDQVQSALLHLIFERKVHSDNLPDGTLVVAAGNYSQSLGNSFGLIPPLMNRFCIFNLIPDNDDIIPFLSRYGAKSVKVDARKILDTLSKNKKVVDDKTLNRIREYFETGVRETTKLLQTDKKIDIKVTDTQNIYSEVEGDGALMGFVTPRTLCYYTDAAIASYVCYGKDGITSSNFKRITEGLVGLGLTRKTKTEISHNALTDVYVQNLCQVAADLDKMDNSYISSYINYFKTAVMDKELSNIKYEDITAVNNKITELRKDPKIASIERPLDVATVQKLCEVFTKKSAVLKDITVDPQTLLDGGTCCELSDFAVYVTNWNLVADSIENLSGLVNDPAMKYTSAATDLIKKAVKSIGQTLPRMKVIKANFLRGKDKAGASIIPDFHDKFVK